MKRAWVLYVGFFVILFTVYLLYVSNAFDFAAPKLDVINDKVQRFSFVNQNGKKITERDVEGKVYVTEYFFTTCRGICPKMNANMRRVYDAFKNEPDFMILSHTCMPETDSVPLLKKYEDKMLNGNLIKGNDGVYTVFYDSAQQKSPVINTTWNFVTGDKSELYKMARYSYLIDNNKSDTTGKIEDQFIHTQFFALLDKQTSVRGIYDGLKEDEIEKLIGDIKSLLKETKPTRSLKGF